MDHKEIRQDFASVYGRGAKGIASAPGRVNLIGEHTDYNDGYVLPIAIERKTLAAFAPRDDRKVTFASLQSGPPASISLDEPLAPGDIPWAVYPIGVAAMLLNHGAKLTGADILFDSDVPIGGGVSSSASLEIAAALALLAAAGTSGSVDPRELAKLCQQAEHEFAKAPCGIMDQTVAIMGKTGKALLLDCRSGEIVHVPFDDPKLVLLVVDTQVKHMISNGGYAVRRDQCYAAAGKLGVASLRDADIEQVEQAAADGKLEGDELRRARHVVTEIDRTLRAVEALRTRDYSQFGRLMYASHESLRDDYDVSCDELDEIVALASRCPGVYGARMTGAGFGGCAILLAEASRIDEITDRVQDGFIKRFAHLCPVFATSAAGGATIAS